VLIEIPVESTDKRKEGRLLTVALKLVDEVLKVLCNDPLGFAWA
jgi:hypothetical protein